MSAPEASPQYTPGPFPALRRQITYRAGVYNDGGLEADLEVAEALLAMLKAMTELVFVLDEANQCRGELTSAWELIAKADGRDAE